MPSNRAVAALALYGLTNETYGKTLDYRRQIAADQFSISASTFRQTPKYERAVLDELSVQVHALIGGASDESRALDDWSMGAHVGEDRFHVERMDLELTIDRLLSKHGARLVVYGEPGVGKSTVVNAVAAARGTRTYTLRTGVPQLLDADLRALLRDERIETQGRSLGDLRLAFDNLLRTPTFVSTVILDDVKMTSEIEAIIDPQVETGARLVVTSRVPLAVPEWLSLAVEDFTEDEARSLVQRHSTTSDSADDILELSRMVGHRPLAVNQMLRLLSMSKRVNTTAVRESLRCDPPNTLQMIARSVQSSRNLSALYQALIDDICQDRVVALVLDATVLLSSNGELTRSSVSLIRAVLSPRVSALEFEASLLILRNYGLLMPRGQPDWSHLDGVYYSRLAYELIWKIRTDSAPQVAELVVSSLRDRWASLCVPPQGPIPVGEIDGSKKHVADVVSIELAFADRLGALDEYQDIGSILPISPAAWIHWLDKGPDAPVYSILHTDREGIRYSAGSIPQIQGALGAARIADFATNFRKVLTEGYYRPGMPTIQPTSASEIDVRRVYE